MSRIDPNDSHSIDLVLKQLKRTIGTQPDILIIYHGYRGEKDFGNTQLLTPSRPIPGYTEYKKHKQRIIYRKEAGIEANISHLKQKFRFGRCSLKDKKENKLS